MAYVEGHIRYLSISDPRRIAWEELRDNHGVPGNAIVIVGAIQWRVWFTGKFESINMED